MAANQFGEVTILENPKKQSLSGKRHARLIDALFNIIVLKDIKVCIREFLHFLHQYNRSFSGKYSGN